MKILDDALRPSPSRAHAFIRDVLGRALWEKQRQIVDGIFSPDVSMVLSPAGTGLGKTTVAADVAVTWLMTCPGRMVITTAPTGRQVRDLLWKEVRSSVAEARRRGFILGGKLPPRAPEIRIGDGWEAIGFSSKDEVNFAGRHSHGGTLVIIDEAVGVPDAIWDTLQATLVGRYDRVLAIANPTIASGRFYDLCRNPPSRTVAVPISAYDSPNVKAGRRVVPGIVEQSAIDRMREAWGEDAAIFRSKVLGLFPEGDDRALVPLPWLEQSTQQWDSVVAEARATQAEVVSTRIGVDVARDGPDSAVIAVARDVLMRVKKMPTVVRIVDELTVTPKSKDLMVLSGDILNVARNVRASSIRIDADGMGAGVFDRLRELGAPVVEMRGGRKPRDPTRYTNARSEWLYEFRQALRPRGGAEDERPLLVVPANLRLQFQATSIRATPTSDGRMAVETKDAWRERVKPRGEGESRSTDELDAVAMAVAHVDEDGIVSDFMRAWGS